MSVGVRRKLIEIIPDHDPTVCVLCRFGVTTFYNEMGSGFKWSTLARKLHKDSIIDMASRAMV